MCSCCLFACYAWHAIFVHKVNSLNHLFLIYTTVIPTFKAKRSQLSKKYFCKTWMASNYFLQRYNQKCLSMTLFMQMCVMIVLLIRYMSVKTWRNVALMLLQLSINKHLLLLRRFFILTTNAKQEVQVHVCGYYANHQYPWNNTYQ